MSRVKEEVRILLEVYSIDNSPLPKDLKVMILDDKKDIVLEDTAENEIVSIALQGLIGEKFSVKITTKDDFILEDFLI
ncbi:MAG TPA: hypothetical protein DCQ63_13320 [Planktothrix sp. UBA8402]|nr:hypothetical protein [Planktothrix sp. UBA8402]